MKHYFAHFTKSGIVEVEFPDLPGCATFGDTWDEAYENAVDVLAGWLAHAEPEFVQPPSLRESLSAESGELVPIPVNEKIMQQYETSKRFNVIFPASALQRVDEYRKAKGLKRSTLLLKAAEEYLEHHASEA